jgi:phosphoglycerate dehydrogenase-like enzyme
MATRFRAPPHDEGSRDDGACRVAADHAATKSTPDSIGAHIIRRLTAATSTIPPVLVDEDDGDAKWSGSRRMLSFRDISLHKLLVLSHKADEYRQLIDAARLPDLSLFSTTDPDDTDERFRECDIAFGEPSLLATCLGRLNRLQWVQANWAGVEPLLAPSLRRDYVLTNARGVFGRLMSEYVFGYLLAHERKIIERYLSQRQRQWDRTTPGTLWGKQIGLLGVGSIGAELARIAKTFGMRVKGYTRSSETSRDVDVYFHGDERIAFAEGLDYLVSVMPGTKATRHLVDEELLRALPERAVFVNPGRGQVVDEQALATALRERRLSAAILDVFQQEPLPPDHEFWSMPNVVITSHTAALNVPADLAALFAENYLRWWRGEPLLYTVDFELGY